MHGIASVGFGSRQKPCEAAPLMNIHCTMLRNELPDDPLFNELWPFACLTAHEVVDARLLHRISGYFDLTIDVSKRLDRIHLRSRLLAEGKHKHQAIRLFAAAIGLVREMAVRSLVLYEVSRLHWHLSDRFGVSPWQYRPDGITEQWVPRPGFITISPVSQLHLRQAGFAFCSLIPRLSNGAILLGPRNLDEFKMPLADSAFGIRLLSTTGA